MSLPIAILRGLIGVAVFIGIAVLFSTNRKAINWGLVAKGIGLQLIFALLVLKTGPGETLFDTLATFFDTLLSFTYEGSEFIFGTWATRRRATTLPFRCSPPSCFLPRSWGCSTTSASCSPW